MSKGLRTYRGTSPGVPNLSEKESHRPTFSGSISHWDRLFVHLPPVLRNDLLAEAAARGCVQFSQLANSLPANHSQLPSWWIQFESKNELVLDPLAISPLTEDEAPELDAEQRHAVAIALNTPDFALLQGPPSPYRNQVVQEVIRRAIAGGWKVLVVLSDLDACHQFFIEETKNNSAWPLFIAGENASESLPSWVQRFTPRDRIRSVRDEMLPAIQAGLAHQEEICRKLHDLNSAWPSLNSLQAEAKEIQEQKVKLVEKLKFINAGESGSNQSGSRPIATGQEHEMGLLTEEIDSLTHEVAARKLERDHVRKELASLEEILAASAGGRVWTKLWWQRLFAFRRRAAAKVLKDRLLNIEKAQVELEDKVSRLRLTLSLKLEEKANADRQDHCQEQRTKEVENEIELLMAQENSVFSRWQAVTGDYYSWSLFSNSLTEVVLDQVLAQWKSCKEQEEKRLQLLRQWNSFLDECSEEWGAVLVDQANLIVATPAGLHSPGGPFVPNAFDWVLWIDPDFECERFIPELLKRAKKCVFVSATHDPEIAQSGGPIQKKNYTPLVQSLWNHFHTDPRNLPSIWKREQNRWCCALRPVLDEHRKWLEQESLADHEDIRLTILSLPGQKPEIAEVEFPEHYSIYHAKAFLFSELQELPIFARASSLRWLEKGERIVCSFCNHCPENHTGIDYGGGIREIVGHMKDEENSHRTGSINWHTCSLEFDKKEGWSLATAQQWLGNKTSLKDFGRTIQFPSVDGQSKRESAIPVRDWTSGLALDQPPAFTSSQGVSL